VRRNRIDLSTGGGLCSILLWSATFALARSLSEQVGPLTGGAAAYLIGGCFCLLRRTSSAAFLTWFLQLPRSYLLGCGSLFMDGLPAAHIGLGYELAVRIKSTGFLHSMRDWEPFRQNQNHYCGRVGVRDSSVVFLLGLLHGRSNLGRHFIQRVIRALLA